MQQDNKNEVHVIHENRYYYYDETSDGGIGMMIVLTIILSILASVVCVLILPAVFFLNESQLTHFTNDFITNKFAFVCILSILFISMSFLMWDFITALSVDFSILLIPMIFLFLLKNYYVLGFLIISTVLYGLVNIDYYKMHVPSRESAWFFFEQMFRVITLYYLIFICLFFFSWGILVKWSNFEWDASSLLSKIIISLICSAITGITVFLSLKHGKSIYFLLINSFIEGKYRKTFFDTIGFKTYFILSSILSFVSIILSSLYAYFGIKNENYDSQDSIAAYLYFFIPIVILLIGRIVKTVRFKQLPDISRYSPYFYGR